MKARLLFEPHLTLNEIKLACHGEWAPKFRGWAFVQLTIGDAYLWQSSGAVRELAAGSALILGGELDAWLRASELNPVVIRYFSVDPGRLGGVLSLGELAALQKAVARRSFSAGVLAAAHPACQRMQALCAAPATSDASMRVQLLELFLNLFHGEIKQAPLESERQSDGRERLKRLLQQTAAEDFMEVSLAELAPRMRCSPRHLSRLFREEVGASFRDKQNEMRLAKACELLATSQAKLLDVALTSGFNSTSPFSILFKKRFGMSPGQWRERHGRPAHQRQERHRMLSV